jgi:uncharacterized RmlC-like cupin family protein
MVLYAQCSTVSFASVHTSWMTHLVTMATMLDTELFLLPQYVPHSECRNTANYGKNQDVTHSHEECDSVALLYTWG